VTIAKGPELGLDPRILSALPRSRQVVFSDVRAGDQPTLRFDAETARLLDEAYPGADFTRRRLANLEALAPLPGDRVIDIGCGPGY
jgi:hypothetical protein